MAAPKKNKQQPPATDAQDKKTPVADDQRQRMEAHLSSAELETLLRALSQKSLKNKLFHFLNDQ